MTTCKTNDNAKFGMTVPKTDILVSNINGLIILGHATK